MNAPTWRAIAASAACGLILAACASLKARPALPEPAPAPPVASAPAPAPTPAPLVVRVPVPVKEACVPKALPKAPKYPDSDAALRDAGGAADRYQLMAAGRLMRERRLADLEKVVEGCR
jgi:glucose/arabinose dehydrogenase